MADVSEVGSRNVAVEVPVRACDVGGWTDTWFAGHGRVCSVAVEPGVRVVADATVGSGVVTIDVADYGERFEVGSAPAAHRLLAAAVREAGPPRDLDVTLTVSAAVPPGSSLGTSAAVCVGLIAALDALGGDVRAPGGLAAAAHRAEADGLGRQSGVQDQQAAAHGGVRLVDMPRYPDAQSLSVAVSATTWRALDDRLVHVAYGSPHDSSAVHERVIAELAEEGPSSPRLERLRQLADRAQGALVAARLDAYAEILTAATEVQRSLHPSLISEGADALIELARSHGSLGWKVNGAGGGGGSLSIVVRAPSDRAPFVDGDRALGHTPLDLSLAPRCARVVPRPR
jgi:D-glycero-alpha-D-manno-heptose-7-phosphate kinase